MLKTLETFLVAEAACLCAPAATPRRTTSAPSTGKNKQKGGLRWIQERRTLT